jgi:hypothetical protein
VTTDPQWPSPGGQPAGPPSDAPQGWYAVPDPNYNWGLAPGGHPNARYAVAVQRPPRPTTVTVALALTYAGVGLSGANAIAGALYNWLNRGKLLSTVTADAPPDGPDMTSFLSTTIAASVVVSLVVWLLAAAGTVVCAVLARRGRNPARIVLAVLVGVFALNNLCGGAAGLFVAGTRSGGGSPSPFNATASLPWWTVPIQLILAVMAALICVLLLLRATNRYFSPGAGRRFVE